MKRLSACTCTGGCPAWSASQCCSEAKPSSWSSSPAPFLVQPQPAWGTSLAKNMARGQACSTVPRSEPGGEAIHTCTITTRSNKYLNQHLQSHRVRHHASR